MDKKQQARIRAESLARISARPDRKPKVPANQAKGNIALISLCSKSLRCLHTRH